MFEQIAVGLIGECETTVVAENTARHLGSGQVSVFATPELVRSMERAAVRAVDHLLPEGYRTVGVHVDVQHLAATPLGMTVRARAELIEVNGRTLAFRVEAFDELEKVGEGLHRRMIINVARFRERVGAKLDCERG
ncbi:MAG TPA: thioesterase family protein [Anaerolineae bacterium]|nr:thioesterase family protein [Anaerolineae bacterium]